MRGLGISGIGITRRRAAALDLNFLTSFDSRITYTRAGTGATRINASGVREVVAAGVPRIDYTTAGVCRGLLIEEARTRLNTVALAPTAPENITVTAQAYTLSFDGAGSYTLSGAHSATVNGSASARTSYTFTPTAGTLTITPSGSVADVQVEAGAFGTSPIRGEGSTVTRAADVATLALGSWFNAAEGVIVADVQSAPINTVGQVAFELGDVGGLGAERIVGRRSAGGVWGVSVVSGGVTLADVLTAATIPGGATYRAAAAFKAGDFAAVSNGGTVATAAPALPVASKLFIGCNYASGQQINGYLRRLRYYRTRLPNSQLQSLTT